MNVHSKDPLEPVGGTETPKSVYVNRRKWLKVAAGAGVVGAATAYAGRAWWRGSDEQVLEGGAIESVDKPSESIGTQPAAEAPDATGGSYSERIAQHFPFERDNRFAYGRDETDRAEAARYTNFYEFSVTKRSWAAVGPFNPYPWQLEIAGLCRNPMKLDIADFHHAYKTDLTERQYRHRCVETWAMAVPWSGIPLAALIKAADPLAEATHVKFVTFMRPDEASQQNNTQFPWPYVEGLTLEEATNDLTFLATGMYGEPLLKQHGAPVRLVVPWKYGFKSIKSIDRIEFTNQEPATFWTTLIPERYPFESNVEPDIHYTPWEQRMEQMLGTGDEYPTQLYNGYGEQVAHLYDRSTAVSEPS